MSPKSRSSRRWLDEHFDDAHVKRAHAEGWRSRAVFKLEEIDGRDRLIRDGMTVVDLGAAPGGWSQYAARQGARVVALDLLAMEPLDGVTFIQGDFREDATLQALRDELAGARVGLVMSDMAPNISGMKAVDQPRAMHLAELALELAGEVLKPGGDFLVKTFQGEGFEALLQDMRTRFETVKSRKPGASRARSNEVYLLARGYVL